MYTYAYIYSLFVAEKNAQPVCHTKDSVTCWAKQPHCDAYNPLPFEKRSPARINTTYYHHHPGAHFGQRAVPEWDLTAIRVFFHHPECSSSPGQPSRVQSTGRLRVDITIFPPKISFISAGNRYPTDLHTDPNIILLLWDAGASMRRPDCLNWTPKCQPARSLHIPPFDRIQMPEGVIINARKKPTKNDTEEYIYHTWKLSRTNHVK